MILPCGNPDRLIVDNTQARDVVVTALLTVGSVETSLASLVFSSPSLPPFPSPFLRSLLSPPVIFPTPDPGG